jgi:hypothetical protein
MKQQVRISKLGFEMYTKIVCEIEGKTLLIICKDIMGLYTTSRYKSYLIP